MSVWRQEASQTWPSPFDSGKVKAGREAEARMKLEIAALPAAELRQFEAWRIQEEERLLEGARLNSWKSSPSPGM
jgi:hypothetical protein